MARMKMLGQRLVASSLSRVPMLTASADSTPRIRGRLWMKIKTDALVASDHFCVACRAEGREVIAVEVDHRTPLWKGGSNEPSNLQGLCKDHHDAKTAQEAAERARRG